MENERRFFLRSLGAALLFLAIGLRAVFFLAGAFLAADLDLVAFLALLGMAASWRCLWRGATQKQARAQRGKRAQRTAKG